MKTDTLFGETEIERIHRMIRCVQREIGMRKSVYPRRISAGQMTQGLADREMTDMQDVLVFLVDARNRALEEGETC